MGSKKLLLMLNRGGKSWIEKNALLYDTFKTDDAAPITSPRTCEPGPGVLTLNDSANHLSISGESLIADGKESATDPTVDFSVIAATPMTFNAGDGIFVVVTAVDASEAGIEIGFDGAFDGGYRENPHIKFNNSFLYAWNSVAATDVPVMATSDGMQYKCLFIPRSGDTEPYMMLIADGKLLFLPTVTPTNAITVVGANNFTAYYNIDDFALLPLADYNSAWGGDWSEVTDTKTNPANNTAFNCAADYHLNTTFTYEAGNYIYWFGRFVSVADYGIRLAATTGGGVQVYQRDADGATLEINAGAGTLSDGVAYEIDLVVNGSNASLYLDKVLIGSTTSLDINLSTSAGYSQNTLASNDVVLTTHPYPALGIADSRVVCPQLNDTYSCSADLVAEIKNGSSIGTSNSSGTRFKFRSQDSNNYVMVQVLDDGRMWLWQVIGGSTTALISAGLGTVSGGDTVVCVLDGANGELFVNGASVGTSSAVPLTTETGGSLSTVEPGSNWDSIACFPRDVSSLLPKGSY